MTARSINSGLLAVTEVKCDNPLHCLSTPQIPEDAYLVSLQLRDYPAHRIWENNKAAPVAALRAGETTLYDIKRAPYIDINNPFHSVHFYFTRHAFNAIADSAHSRRIDELKYRPGRGVDDYVMRGLTQALLPAFANPEQANRLFVEQVTLSVGVHAAATYGGMTSEAPKARGGLAPWQAKRALEMIDAHLDGDVSPVTLAQECGLSTTHFARAFRKTTGLAPHRWLLERRIEKARHMLCNDRTPLIEIATACGFADQSHFTRVFTRLVGISPGAWRRQNGAAKAESKRENA